MDPVGAALAAVLDETTPSGGYGRVFVGFSGGLDSTVLLHAVTARRRSGVTAVHVHHGLHGDADRWQRHAEGIATALGAGFAAHQVTVGSSGSLEAAARDARYAVFRTLLDRPDDVLLLAHHRDDQAETVLLRLLQGRGLYGMPARRPLAAGTLLRPLLELPRASLLDYARAHGLDWVEDPGNVDLRMDRNFLRHRVMPALRGRFVDVDQALIDALDRQHRYDTALAAGLEVDRDAIDLARLGWDDTVAIERLRVWLSRHGVAHPGRTALTEFLQQVRTAAADRAPELALRGARLRRHRERIHLLRPPPALRSSYVVTAPGCLHLPHGELRIERAGDGFRPTGAVTVRFRRGGERLTSGGHGRTVKSLLQSADVAPWRRPGFPLLYDARGLLAVPGLAVRDDARVTEDGYRAVWQPGAADSANR